MSPTRWMFCSAAGAMAALVLAAIPLTFAHDDHAPPPTDGFDPFAPRSVPEATAKMIGLQVAEADFGTVETVERLTGVVRIAPDRRHVISPRIAGTVATVYVQEGDQVTSGQVLLEIESPEYARLRYELATLESEKVALALTRRMALGRAEQAAMTQQYSGEMLELAHEELLRLEQTAEAVSANLVNQKKSALLALRAEVKAAELEHELATDEADGLRERIDAIEAARQSLTQVVGSLAGSTAGAAASGARLVMRAPVDGVVASRRADPGQDVQAGDRMLVIVESDRVQVIAELPESRLQSVAGAAGAPVRIRQPRRADLLAEGALRAIGPMIDQIKRTAHVIIDAENANGELFDGMFVEVAIVLDEGDFAVVAPHEAVLKDGPERYVYVREGEQFRRRPVALGASNDQFVEVVDGLVPGDEIIVRGAYAVSQLRPRSAMEAGHDHDHGHGHSH